MINLLFHQVEVTLTLEQVLSLVKTVLDVQLMVDILVGIMVADTKVLTMLQVVEHQSIQSQPVEYTMLEIH